MHMKKTFRMLLTLALVMLGVTTMSAGERISLQEVPFCSWDGWVNASPTGKADCAWVVETSTDLPYGDTKVINYADLSLYSKLIVTVTEGTPRFLFNRDIDEGQYNATESESHLIDNTRGGWCSKYFSSVAGEEEGVTVYTVDLKQMVADKGYAHLHSIKSGAWGQTVTVLSMEVERQGKAKQVGWTSIITNGNLEGDDVSSFAQAINAVADPGVYDVTIVDGAGVNGSRGIVIESMAGATQDWATQFFVKFGEDLPEGTQWRFTMDVKADNPISGIGGGCHQAPREWFDGSIIPAVDFASDWTTVKAEGTIDAVKANKLRSIAFDLNKDRDNANTFYFDNINFEVYKYGTTAEFSNDVVQVDFGFDTNMPALVKKAGKPRLMFPMDCATVKVNGKAVALYSVEGFADGRFYIFLEEAVEDNDQVLVSFTNPTDEAYHLIYTSGPSGDVNSFVDEEATHNNEIEDNDGYPYDFLTPTLLVGDPENGSFNLPLDIKEFKLHFDKNVDCEALVATINKQPLAKQPATGFATDIVLTHEGAFTPGEYSLNITKIYPEMRLADEIFGDTTLVMSIGPSDPTDIAYDVIPVSYFNDCADNTVPEGYILYADGETPERRVPGGNYSGGGNRMFTFGAGGDFTKGLYMRTWYLDYGEIEDHTLALEAGKKYNLSFNAAIWNDRNHGGNHFVNVQVVEIQRDGEEIIEGDIVFEKTIKAAPVLGESKNAVKNSAVFNDNFVIDKDGIYLLKLIASKDENGTPANNDWYDLILANVKMSYVPATAGGVEMAAVAEALAKAISARDAAADERYDGAAFDALTAAINKVEAEKAGYTSPSACYGAVELLNASTVAFNEHIALCDEYDTQVKKAIDVQRQNEMPDGDPAKATKFTKTELFAQLKAILAKYNASSQWVDYAEPGTINEETGEEVHDWHLEYTFDLLKDDAQLKTAAEELKAIANITSLLFTEGPSAPENANGGKGTGVAVLVERLRLGAEALKSLGVAEDDALVVAAKNALTDDDQLADNIKRSLKTIVYGKLKEAGNDMFTPVVNEETGEETAPTYDMTVFVKNPNTYKLSDGVDFTDESVPGWVTPEGYNRPGLSPGWGAWQGTSEIAQDAMFQTWGASYRVEQTVTDLPVGVYTVNFAVGERNNGDAGVFEDSYTYVTNTIGEEYLSPLIETKESGEEMYIPGIGQSFPFVSDAAKSIKIEDILVTDGQLTIGMNAGPNSHTFFNEVRVLLTAPVANFDYGQAWLDGIDATVAQPAKVRAIELYDLNGQRVNTARQGVVLVKKYMSDGTVRTEKVVKK